MAAKNHRQWIADPILKQSEWVDSRIYTDQQIFEEELEKIFKKTWIPVCHESELPKPTISAPPRLRASRSSSAAVRTTRCAPFSTSARIAA